MLNQRQAVAAARRKRLCSRGARRAVLPARSESSLPVLHAWLLMPYGRPLTAAAGRMQPVSYVSLALTLGTGAGLVWYYNHLKEQKLAGAHSLGLSPPCQPVPHSESG